MNQSKKVVETTKEVTLNNCQDVTVKITQIIKLEDIKLDSFYKRVKWLITGKI